MPKVSVIIPCFNHGQYIDKAVDSVLAQTFQDFEIIIVNDGSTDNYTNELLDNYIKPKIKVIKTENTGPSSARNTGIENALGEYILPLDADDYIDKEYLIKAVRVLESDKNIRIIYCLAEKFGKVNEKWYLPNFSITEIYLRNCIFSSGLFRKADWLKVKGYAADMIYGYEDWDFWLSILGIDGKVFRIPEVLFFTECIRYHETMKLIGEKR